jgi:hypothetical protein
VHEQRARSVVMSQDAANRSHMGQRSSGRQRAGQDVSPNEGAQDAKEETRKPPNPLADFGGAGIPAFAFNGKPSGFAN